MDWQLTVVGLAVSAAVAYLARAAWKTWVGGKGGCGSGCGKCTAPTTSPERTDRISLPQV